MLIKMGLTLIQLHNSQYNLHNLPKKYNYLKQCDCTQHCVRGAPDDHKSIRSLTTETLNKHTERTRLREFTAGVTCCC